MTGGTVGQGTKTLAQLGLRARDGRDPAITGLSLDSRTVKPGHLFAALPGSVAHGADFIPYALRMGAGAVLTEQDEDEIIDRTARALADGKAVGWFRGRMEFGPRALGGRSILGDPRSDSMQKTLNLKVKFRESFRPFAPSVLREEVGGRAQLVQDELEPELRGLVLDDEEQLVMVLGIAHRMLRGEEPIEVEVRPVRHLLPQVGVDLVFEGALVLLGCRRVMSHGTRMSWPVPTPSPRRSIAAEAGARSEPPPQPVRSAQSAPGRRRSGSATSRTWSTSSFHSPVSSFSPNRACPKRLSMR